MKKTMLFVLLCFFGITAVWAQTSLTHFNNGVSYFEQGNVDAAIREFTESIRLDPNNANAYNYRGVMYFNQGNYDRAIVDFTEVIRFNSQFAVAYYYRGLAYYNQKNYDRAIADFTETIRLDPQNAMAYNYRGTAYAERAQQLLTQNRITARDVLVEIDRAIADFEASLQIDSNQPNVRHNLGIWRNFRAQIR